jgi:hypothetical protein
MSLKLKIFLAVLLLIAGFLVVRAGLYLNNSIKSAASANLGSQVLSAQEENPLAVDSDNDGIPDIEEAYYRTDPFNPDTDGDGFLDGEEVVSGFNPTKKDESRETDKSEKINVTENLTDRLVAGIFAGDLNPKNSKDKKYENGINNVILAALDDAAKTLYPQTNNENEIRTSDDSKESQEAYLKSTAHILEGPFLDSFMQQAQALNRAVNLMAAGDNKSASQIFNDLSMKFTTAYTELLVIPVPPSWVNFHKHLLRIFQKISINYSALSKASEDPVLALVALDDFSNNMLDINLSLMMELKNLIQKNNLEIPKSPLFEVLDILNFKP